MAAHNARPQVQVPAQTGLTVKGGHGRSPSNRKKKKMFYFMFGFARGELANLSWVEPTYSLLLLIQQKRVPASNEEIIYQTQITPIVKSCDIFVMKKMHIFVIKK